MLRTILLIGGVAALLWLERKRPLRQPVEPGPQRVVRNLALGAVTAATVAAIERPIVTRVARITEQQRWGLVARLPVPIGLKGAIALALMDYTLYWWHVLLHRVPALWRVHAPHHTDRDLDTSTGVRFHFAEFLASIPWRSAQVVVIGVTPRTLALWQTLTLAEVLFHHSNLQLPRAFERHLSRIVVTPRLHGIHHSVLESERNTNFSSGLSVWDQLHGTANRELGRDDVVIGLPGYRSPWDATLLETMTMPFEPGPSLKTIRDI